LAITSLAWPAVEAVYSWQYKNVALLLSQVSLFEVMPSMCVGDLVKILDDYARDQ
jgi:hypothetical protein